MILTLVVASLIILFPGIELRGGIPFAVLVGINAEARTPLWLAFVFCTLFNFLCVPINYFFLDNLNKYMLRLKWYEKFYNNRIEKIRKSIEPGLNKYGYWGLMIFVAIPLPGTGAYSGTIAAWLFNMNRKKASVFICLGVVIAGIAVSAVVYLIQHAAKSLPGWINKLFLQSLTPEKAMMLLWATLGLIGVIIIAVVLTKVLRKRKAEN